MPAQTITPELQRDLKLQKVLDFGEIIFYTLAKRMTNIFVVNMT
jgi:hypothetical protein